MMIDHNMLQALKTDAGLDDKLNAITKAEMAKIREEFTDPQDEYTIMLLTTMTEFAELSGQLLQTVGVDPEGVLDGPMQSMCGCIMKITGKDKDYMVRLAQAATRLRNAVRDSVQAMATVKMAEQERANATLQ